MCFTSTEEPRLQTAVDELRPICPHVVGVGKDEAAAKKQVVKEVEVKAEAEKLEEVEVEVEQLEIEKVEAVDVDHVEVQNDVQ